MRDSIIIVLFFAAGLFLGVKGMLPDILLKNSFSTYALYILLFLVGTGMGSDKNTWELFRKKSGRLIFVPLAVVIGSMAGAATVSFLFSDLSLKSAVAVGSGFGYYSLSSVIIAEIHSETLGVIALLSNISREIITLVFTPFLVKLFGPLSGVASGGATAMDTTLPVISKFSGKDIGPIALFSGLVLTILTPFIVTLILKL